VTTRCRSRHSSTKPFSDSPTPGSFNGKTARTFSCGGLTVEETAEALHVSTDTVKRDWRVARLWLLRELKESKP